MRGDSDMGSFEEFFKLNFVNEGMAEHCINIYRIQIL